MHVLGVQNKQAAAERAEEGEGAAVRHPDTQRGGDHGGWIQVAHVWPESRQKQP